MFYRNKIYNVLPTHNLSPCNQVDMDEKKKRERSKQDVVIWGDYKEKRSLGKLKAFNKGQRYQGQKSLAQHMSGHIPSLSWPQTYNINELDMFVNLTMLLLQYRKKA